MDRVLSGLLAVMVLGLGAEVSRAAVFEAVHARYAFDQGVITPQPFAPAFADYSESGAIPETVQLTRGHPGYPNGAFPSLASGTLSLPNGSRFASANGPATQGNHSVVLEAVIRYDHQQTTAPANWQFLLLGWDTGGLLSGPNNISPNLQFITDGAGGGVLRAAGYSGIAAADVRTPTSLDVLDRWMHVGIVFTEGSGFTPAVADSLDFYIGGTLIGTTTTIGGLNPSGLNGFFIGHPFSADGSLGGQLDIDAALVRSFTGTFEPSEFALLPEPTTIALFTSLLFIGRRSRPDVAARKQNQPAVTR